MIGGVAYYHVDCGNVELVNPKMGFWETNHLLQLAKVFVKIGATYLGFDFRAGQIRHSYPAHISNFRALYRSAILGMTQKIE